MFPRSWFGAAWFAAPYWRPRNTTSPPGPTPDPNPDPTPLDGTGLWPVGWRGTCWRVLARGETCQCEGRPVVWRLPSR